MTRDIKLKYDQAGQGAPPLVFVHGFAGGREQWQPQARHFARTNRVFCLDLRGHGASVRGTEELTMQTLAADVVGLLEELELSGAVLAGHSMGCRIVLEARRQAPGRIAGVVLVDGSNIGLGDKEGALARIEGEIAEKGYEGFARKLFEDMFVEGYDPALKEQVMTRARALPEETGHPLFKGIVAYDADDVVEVMRGCGIPVLVLQSTAMGVDRVRRSLREGESSLFMDIARGNCPQAEFTVIPGVGHYAQLEAPNAVNGRIAQFLGSLRS